VRLTGYVRISILKIFHPPPDYPGTHAGISMHTTKTLVGDIWRVSLYYKKFNDSTLMKLVGDSPFSQCVT
jgi:hypothetical protein